METPPGSTPPPPAGGAAPAIGGEGPVYLACAATGALTFLPWIHFSFAGTQLSGLDPQITEMFASMGVSGSIQGIDVWPGRIALIAALACAGLTWAEGSGAVRWDKGNALLATAGCAAVTAGATLFAVFDYGRMSQIGLYLALAAAGAALWFALARVRELGQWRSATAQS